MAFSTFLPPPPGSALTWRKACSESFRRTATAAMVTACRPLAAERGAATEAWTPEGEDERPPRLPPSACSARRGPPRPRPSPRPAR